MALSVRAGMRGMLRMLPKALVARVEGKRLPRTFLARKSRFQKTGLHTPLISAQTTTYLTRMFKALKNGFRHEARALSTEVKEAASDSPENYRKLKEAVTEIMKKPEEERTKSDLRVIRWAQHRELKLVGRLHDIHNWNMAKNEAYREAYEETVFSYLTRTCAAQEMLGGTFVFRGVQFDKSCSADLEDAQLASPKIMFDAHSSGPVFSMGRNHQGDAGWVIPPTIHDAYLSSHELGRIGWTAGVVAQSLDALVSANYSRSAQGLGTPEGRCNGYIYMMAPRRTISLANHLHYGLSDLETSGAHKNYEIVSAASDPTTIICAWRVDKSGNLGAQIFNPKADGAVKKLYSLAEANNPALWALRHSPNVKVLGELYQQHEDPEIQAFHKQLALDQEAHKQRVTKRLDALRLERFKNDAVRWAAG